MELKLIFEFAIALTVAPIVLCWAIDLVHFYQSVRRGQFRWDKRGGTTVTTDNKNSNDSANNNSTTDTTDTTGNSNNSAEHHRPKLLYTSKAVAHRVSVSEGYPNKLSDFGELYKVEEPTTDCLADHLHALGLGGQQLKDLKAAELRKLASRMGIRGAARGRKQDLLKAMRGQHGYA